MESAQKPCMNPFARHRKSGNRVFDPKNELFTITYITSKGFLRSRVTSKVNSVRPLYVKLRVIGISSLFVFLRIVQYFKPVKTILWAPLNAD